LLERCRGHHRLCRIAIFNDLLHEVRIHALCEDYRERRRQLGRERGITLESARHMI